MCVRASARVPRMRARPRARADVACRCPCRAHVRSLSLQTGAVLLSRLLLSCLTIVFRLDVLWSFNLSNSVWLRGVVICLGVIVVAAVAWHGSVIQVATLWWKICSRVIVTCAGIRNQESSRAELALPWHHAHTSTGASCGCGMFVGTIIRLLGTALTTTTGFGKRGC